SLIRTAEQLKIKGLCEINDHTNATESDAEVVYPPHKKIRASRNYDNNNSSTNCNKNLSKREEYHHSTSKSSSSVIDKDAHQSITSSHEDNKHKSKSPQKEQKNASSLSSTQHSKNMASLEMGMNFQNGNVVMGVPLTYMDFAPEPPAPTATPVITTEMNCNPSQDTKDLSHSTPINGTENARIIKFETLRSLDPTETIVEFDNSIQHSICRLDQVASSHHPTVSSSSPILHHSHHSPAQVQIITTLGNMDVDGQQSSNNGGDNVHGIVVTPEIGNMMTTPTQIEMYHSDTSDDAKMQTDQNGSGQLQYITLGNNSTPSGDGKNNSGPKTWTPNDMEAALEALRSHNMSLTKASATYGIPSTTLWQRAHRLGIDTPKKEGPTKTWNEDSLNNALDALRTGTISANKASKAFGIPSSTLYKIARREGIRLAAPFNAAPTTWSAEDLEKALEAIRAGAASVQKASTEFGIPTGTLYGRCKREGIELSRSNPTPWSEDAMMEALDAVRVGQMSINQAAIHYNLPYSSLYGRFKRGKYGDPPNGNPINDSSHNTTEHSPDNSMSYGHHTLIADSNATAQLQENQIIYQQHYSPSTQIIHQQPPQQIYHHQQIIYQNHPQPPQILQIHQIKKETS
ncbi:CLUMA_CG001906, isoform A, partial [Clunio marinus]